MSPEAQIHDGQPSMELDWPSFTDLSSDLQASDLDYIHDVVLQNNDDLSALLDLEICDTDSTAETSQRKIESPHSESQFTPEKSPTHLTGVTQPTTGAPPLIANANDSTPTPIDSNPELATQKASETNSQARPEFKSIQELEAQLRFLRHKPQNGLLPTTGNPEVGERKTVSAYVKKLEHIGDPPQNILRATRIPKLPQQITNLDDIPRNGNFSFKERASTLLEKWGTNLEEVDQTRSTPGQLVKHDGTGLGAIADEQNPTNMADARKLLSSGEPTLATSLVEEQAPNMIVGSKQLIDHTEESTLIEANQPTPYPPAALQNSSGTKSGRLVIDLTDDSEVDMATGLGLSGQPTEYQDLDPSEAKSTQTPHSPSIPSTGEYFSPGSKKRKRPNVIDDSLVSASGSASGKHNTPNRQRPQRKTSPGKHLNNEILWMSGSVSRIEKMIEDVEKEIDAIKMRRVLLHEKNERMLEENKTDMQSAQRRMNESIELKEYLLAWGAQDEKVTKEWSSSGYNW
ncbi:uncharacterized protein RAG0_12594 [Rhynchosporium agropyri]|uniref:Uncharacterized protein n=1 Tax=Rhynchosporium agropyri TaxID=914238 RepID=A0A1E1L8Y3_9HELO|nr:uncharacterized protein RAG0_12594 [Rhynchosporium agropyri]